MTVTEGRYGIMRNIMIGMGSLLFFLFILMCIFAGLFGGKHVYHESLDVIIAKGRAPYEHCLNDRYCLAAAGWHNFIKNDKVDPCENLFEHACGNWVKTSIAQEADFSTGEITIPRIMTQLNDAKIENVINDLYYNPSLEYEYKLKSYYYSCNQQHEREKDKGTPLLKELAKEGGFGAWYVVDQDMTDWDFNTSMQAANLELAAEPFLKLSIELAKRTDPKSTIVSVRPGGFGYGITYRTYMYENYFFYKRRINAYKSLIHDIGMMLAKDHYQENFNQTIMDDVIDTFVDDVYTVEKALAGVHSKTRTKYPNWNTGWGEEYKKTISELNKELSHLNWRAFLSIVYGRSIVLGPDFKVLLAAPDYLANLETMFKKLDEGGNFKRQLNNYIAWRIIFQFLEDLSEGYYRRYLEYRNVVYSQSYKTVNVPLKDRCLARAKLLMPDAVGALFVRDHFGDTAKPYIDEIYKYLKVAVIDGIHDLAWMDNITQVHATQKIILTNDKVAYPPEYNVSTPEKINAKYSSLRFSAYATLFQNELAIEKWRLVNEMAKLRDGTASQYVVWPVRVTSANSYYWSWRNELLIPAGALQQPLFSTGQPHFLNFAIMGSNIMSRLITAIGRSGSYTKPDGSPGRWWSDDTSKKYTDALQCDYDLFHNQTAGPYYWFGNNEVLQITKYGGYTGALEKAGLKYAYKAYKLYVQDKGEEKRLPALADTLEKQFFLAYASGKCFYRSDYKSYQNVAYYNRVPEDVLVNVAVGQMEEFHKAFGCAANSTMGEIRKHYQCELF